MRRSNIEVPYGKCRCGCGGDAPISQFTNQAYGWEKGKPKKYILGHSVRLSQVDYLEEDRGHATPCWVWQMALAKAGYGLTHVNGKTTSAHRFYYENRKGTIEKGLQLDHLCKVRCCVNPDHLEPVTNATNSRRGNMTRLTREDTHRIKELRASGLVYREIAAIYGITQQYASVIVRGKKWVAV